MHRKFTAQSSLASLRKEAKRWLHALRANDTQALERLRRHHPGAKHPPALRDVQHALAREHGAADWIALKDLLLDDTLARQSHQQRVDEFLEHSCIHYGIRPGTSKWDITYADEPARWRYAARILERHPEVRRDSIHTAAVSGDIDEVRRILLVRPQAAMETGGRQSWQPLVYVCYGRLPLPAASDNAVAIARALLDSGADLTGNFDSGEGMFRCLTGAIGGGEFAQPPHPDAVALATLLIDAGADPYEPQALYDTSLGNDDVFWLDFLYERSAQRQETHKWRNPSQQWPVTGALNYLLTNAISGNGLQRAQWVLQRGADANSTHFYSKRNLHTEALLRGFPQMADLLVRFGAIPEILAGHDAFQVACMRLDRHTAAAIAREHPDYLLDPAPLLQAARLDLLEAATLLLDLGMSPDVHSQTDFRPLHEAAGHDSVRVGRLLIERGAAIDPREKKHNGPPLGWALHAKAPRMIELLGRLSRDRSILAYAGNIERLRELYNTEPALFATGEDSLLFHLPEDEDRAVAMVEFLLSIGADPGVRNKNGLTAAESAEKRGLDAVVHLLS